MAWIDLVLELVAQFSSPQVMRRLSKILLIDTADREQRYYQQFIPNYQHGDKLVLAAQQHIARHYSSMLSVQALAQIAFTTERTLLRRFQQTTKMTPSIYIQRFRVQKACDLLESSKESIENIAYKVGFQNVNAFRKLFVKVMGLSPQQFRMRFDRKSLA
jgi:transcriptional regulator GlxA family with amidase domain